MAIDFELNRNIEDELSYCVPATAPECPDCGYPMNLLPGEYWACGQPVGDCKNSDLYEWHDGQLFRADDETDDLHPLTFPADAEPCQRPPDASVPGKLDVWFESDDEFGYTQHE